MRNHTVNLFKLSNLHDLDFSYKLVEFDLPSTGKEDQFNKQLQKISRQVASLSGGPSAIVKREGKHYVAIPSDKTIADDTINVVPFNVKISLLPQVYTVKGSNATTDNIEVVYKFLDFEIRKQLSRCYGLWKLNSGQFFSKTSVTSQPDAPINIFEGFSYKLVVYNTDLYVCVDLATKYVDKNLLSYYVNSGNVASIGERFKGKRFLYLNNDNWYATELVGFGKNIQQHEFNSNGDSVSVYDYILGNARSRREAVSKVLKPTDLTMLYKYPGRTMEPHSGACSLAKMLYTTRDKEVKSLHKHSIKDPGRRFDEVKAYVKKYFQNLNFNSTMLKINMNPLILKIPHFRIPELKFANGKTLIAGHYSQGGNTLLREFASERKQLLLNNGVLAASSFDEQFLIVPSSMDRNLVESFKKNAEHQIRAMASTFPGFKIICYPDKSNQPATFQIQEIERVLKQQNALAGFALFVLPDLSRDSGRYIKTFHDCLKNKFYPDLKLQCASAHKITSFFSAFPSNETSNAFEYRVPVEKRPRFKSYLVNLVIEHLIVNRKWPFSLNNNLHYDIYIGIDVHDRYAGFTFFFKNGENIFFFPEKVPLKNKSQRAEKLKTGLLTTVLGDKLRMLIPNYCPSPNGIVLIRDGRSFGEEIRAFNGVVAALTEEGLVPNDVKHGVVDLHKQSSVPLRIASHTNGFTGLENPMAGSFIQLNEKEGYLYNTGFPFKIPGTAKPLNLQKASGNIDFVKVAEDVFCQTALAFSAPDRSNSLPITIKLIDTLLEPLAGGQEPMEEEEIEEFEDSEIL